MSNTTTQKQLTEGEKFKQAALAIVHALEKELATSDAEKLVEDLVHAVGEGIVAGVELVSPPGIKSIEELTLPWLESKGEAAVDGLIAGIFSKLGAKTPAPAAPTTTAEAASALNSL